MKFLKHRCEGVLEESVPSPEGRRATDTPRGELSVAESKEGESCIQLLEWSVVVFPKNQGHGRKVICADARHNIPPLEGDWERHPCCGTICVVRSGCLRKPKDQEKFGKTYL